MADESAIVLTKAGETQLAGKTILYAVADPDGVPDDYRVNLASISDRFYKIAATIASNAITVAVQHLDGTAPSTNNPIAFRIGNSIKVATGALTFTKSAGTNWMNAGSAELAAQAIDFFVYVVNETGASAGMKLLISRIPYAVTMADFVNTTTNEKYPAGGWVNFNSTDEVQLIGRIRAQLSAGASYNWSIVTAKVINRPIYETDWMECIYTAQGSGGSAGAYAEEAGTVTQKYKVRGNSCIAIIQKRATNLGSWTGNVTLLLPLSRVTASAKLYAHSVVVMQNGTVTARAVGDILGNVVQFESGLSAAFLQWSGMAVGDWFIGDVEYEI